MPHFPTELMSKSRPPNLQWTWENTELGEIHRLCRMFRFGSCLSSLRRPSTQETASSWIWALRCVSRVGKFFRSTCDAAEYWMQTLVAWRLGDTSSEFWRSERRVVTVLPSTKSPSFSCRSNILHWMGNIARSGYGGAYPAQARHWRSARLCSSRYVDR